ncbi:GNAT family N-acetyltransferase, partial [Teichococcus deserti]|uniref:GNAT family N-acetyltransferase n=1 Tax=Teichococcus deserti TaxID=1817963 RepID=UPI001A95A6D2
LGAPLVTTLRRAIPADAESVGALVDALLMELAGIPSRRDARVEAAARLLALSDCVFGVLAVDDDGQDIGVIMLTESASIYAGGAFGVITELYVAPAHRSSGLAQRLLMEAESIGRARAWPLLEVGAPRQPQWARSLSFYLRHGFTEIGPRLKRPL